MKSICVIGLGYIGLPTSVMFAKHGYRVHGVDVNKKVVEKLSNKQLHIEEPGLQEAFDEVVASGALSFDTEPQTADVFVVAVPSPITDENTSDLDYIRAATRAITPYVEKGNLVILESTVPPRTVEDVMIPILKESGLVIGEELYVSHSPERVIPGKIMTELTQNDRIVGGINEKSAEMTKELYEKFVQGSFHLTDATTAEAVKVMENTYRDVNIAFANELAQIADHIGINVWEAIKLANFHPRVNIHQPGPGVGGHCIAVDPWFLAEQKPELANIITLSRNTNNAMPEYTVNRMQQIIEQQQLVAPKIALYGLSFKGNVDDMRESPSLKVMEYMNQAGLAYKVFDPYIKDIRVPHQVVEFDELIEDADMLVVLTDHRLFTEYDPQEVAAKMKTPLLFDTKNLTDQEKWEQQGFTHIRLGDSKNR